jgi:hypothetical protein
MGSAVEPDAADEGYGRLLHEEGEPFVESCALHAEVGGQPFHVVGGVGDVLFYKLGGTGHKFFLLGCGFRECGCWTDWVWLVKHDDGFGVFVAVDLFDEVLDAQEEHVFTAFALQVAAVKVEEDEEGGYA